MFGLTKSLSDFPYGLTHHHLVRELINAGVTSCKEIYQVGNVITINFTSDYTGSLSTINSVITEYRPVPAYFDDLKFVTITSADSPHVLTTKSVKCDTSAGNIAVVMPKTQRAKKGIFAIQKIASAGLVIITPNGAETINGGASEQLSANKSYIVLRAVGTDWISVIGDKVDATANDSLTAVSTAGDILVDNGVELTPLSIGVDGSVLTADSTQPLKVRWGTTAGGVSACTEVSTSASTSTTSSKYVLMNGMTSTPASGTYLVMFSSSGSPSSASAIATYAVYVGDTINTSSERSFRGTTSTTHTLYTQAKITANGSQTVEIRYKTSAGTFTVGARNMEIVAVY